MTHVKRQNYNLFLLFVVVLSIAGLLSGCAVTQKVGKQIAELTNRAKGEYYLRQEQFSEGIDAMKAEIAHHPEDADIYYYLGRYHLALEQIAESRRYLHKAVQLAPYSADYFFWWGVALGAAGVPDRERRAYLRCLELDPKHSQALIYLGHNLLDAKRYQGALKRYQNALELAPTNPQALYNRAYAMYRLQRTPEAIIAWKIYLYYYTSGAFARQAVHYLNRMGDFDYRLYRIGRRQLVVPRIQFIPFGSTIDPATEESLENIGRAVSQNSKVVLQILIYQKNNLSLAKARARRLKSYLLERFPEIGSMRIKTSWFKVPQKITISGATHSVASSVHFFTTPQKRAAK